MGLSLGEKIWRVERAWELLSGVVCKMGFEDEVGVSRGQSLKVIQGEGRHRDMAGLGCVGLTHALGWCCLSQG